MTVETRCSCSRPAQSVHAATAALRRVELYLTHSAPSIGIAITSQSRAANDSGGNEECVHVYVSGVLNDIACSAVQAACCQAPTYCTPSTTPTPTASSTNTATGTASQVSVCSAEELRAASWRTVGTAGAARGKCMQC